MKKNTALLIMDMQVAVLAGIGDPKQILERTAEAISYAKISGCSLIFVKVGFRQGGPEIHPDNKMFGGNKDRYSAPNLEEMMKIHPDLSPELNDIIILKRRVSAFSGSDLQIVLRSLHIEHIVLAGVSTSGVVLSTLREAADSDYLITVLADCCADRDPEVHKVLLGKVFPMQAQVFTVSEWKAQEHMH